MKAAQVISTMVPPVTKPSRQAHRIGNLAATSLGGFAWATTLMLRSLRRLDAWLSRRQGKQARV